MLLVIVDTLRADSLGAYGGRRNVSPSFDALAKESVLFERAVASAPRTWQSIATLLTGLYPFNHGVRFIYDQPLSSDRQTIGTVLAGAGYDTATFGSSRFLRELTAERGFATHVDPPEDGAVIPDAVVGRHLLSWVRNPRRRPFLAVVHFRGPHWPYSPKPEHHDALYSGSRNDHSAIDHSFNSGNYGLVPVPGQGFHLADAESYRRRIFHVDPRPEVREHMRLHYAAAVLGIDEILGDLIERLRRSAVLQRTLVVITSDHGESFGEHGYLQHGPRVDEAALNVPLLIRLPEGHGRGRPGQRVPQLVRTADVLPTILDALDLEVPPRLDGCSLMPIIDEGRDLRLTAYAENGREFMGVDPELALPGVAGRHRMLRNLRFKLVYRPGKTEPRYSLHDLQYDPGEQKDISAQRPDVYKELRTQLDRIVANDRDIDRPETGPTPRQREKLRALGYVQ